MTEKPSQEAQADPLAAKEDVVCRHGTAMDVHCCGCHSGFLFDIQTCKCLIGDCMDMRNGDIYSTLADALDAGVPAEHAAEVDVEIVRVASGPFKGRVYQRNLMTRQLERRFDLEKNTQEA